MIQIYLGKNGSGKTHKLNSEYNKKMKDKIFFPCASEVLSTINGKTNKNSQGTNGGSKNKTYNNAIITLIKLICEKDKANIDENIKHIVNEIKDCTEKYRGEMNKQLKKIFCDSESKDDETKYIEFENELIESYTRSDIPYLKEHEYLYKILNEKNEFKSEGFSHGHLSFNTMKFCLKLIEKYKIRGSLSLYFDEPDNYLNPQLINELGNLITQIKECDIHISTHNPYFITSLLNSPKIKSEDIEIYWLIKTKQNDGKDKYECKQLASMKLYITPSLLMYEIYGVYTIDLLDFYIGECKTNKFDKANDHDAINNENVVRIDKYFKPNVESKCIENGTHKHFSIIHLVRNYYHHPQDRKDMDKDMCKKMKEGYEIEKLLKEAINNILVLLDKEDCSTHRLKWNEDKSFNDN